MEGKKEMLNEQRSFDDTYDYIYFNKHFLCLCSFLFLSHLSGQSERLYLSHHMCCHPHFMFVSPLLIPCLANLSENCDKRKLEVRVI